MAGPSAEGVRVDEVPMRDWAALVRTVLTTDYPYSAAHTTTGPDDADVTPARLHPGFHGCFDWHSSVHMHWSLVRMLTVAATGSASASVSSGLGEEAERAVALLDRRLTPERVDVEAAYLRAHPGWERPYGWAWAASLAAACATSDHPGAPRWAGATRVLHDATSDLVLQWLPRQAYPVRHGVHSNTAFALTLLHEAATSMDRPDVVAAVADRARAWFGADRAYPTTFEPSGSDFLSPALTEAELMRRVLPAEEFGPWLAAFLPDLGEPGSRLLGVPEVLDPTDGHLVHLFGLALSRAWLLRSVTSGWAPTDRRRVAARRAADAQEAFAQHAVVHGDFMSTHWLVSFALLARGLG